MLRHVLRLDQKVVLRLGREALLLGSLLLLGRHPWEGVVDLLLHQHPQEVGLVGEGNSAKDQARRAKRRDLGLVVVGESGNLGWSSLKSVRAAGLWAPWLAPAAS